MGAAGTPTYKPLGTGGSGTPGPPGPQGPQGPQGFEGPEGEQGDPGPPGPAGAAGATGSTGPAGPQGPIGLMGLDGEDGEPGSMGAAGATGATGATGSAGATGAQGPMGFPGVDGEDADLILLQGPAGPRGLQGPMGSPGLDADSSDFDLPMLSGAVGGQGVPTQVAFWSSTGQLGGDTSLTWSPPASTLTVGTGAVSSQEFIVINGGATNSAGFQLQNNSVINVWINSTGAVPSFGFGGSTGTLNFVSNGGLGSTVASLTQAGSFTAIGNTHNFGTAGTACVLSVGQGTTSTDNTTIFVISGNSGTTNPSILLCRNTALGGVSKWTSNGTDTFFDYTGNLKFRTSVNGTAKHIIDTNGIITTYNNIATVTNGVPSILAQVNLTTQAAAIGSTLLYAVPAAGAGTYRISYVATVTRAATTSSTLGGTPTLSAGGFQIDWTDADDSVSKLSPGGNAITAGQNSTPATPTNQANTTGASISGCIIVNAKASTNINYRIGYTSTGATTMQYNLHVRLEAL